MKPNFLRQMLGLTPKGHASVAHSPEADASLSSLPVHPDGSPGRPSGFSVEDVVRSAYASILRRQADPGGLAAYTEQLTANPEIMTPFFQSLLMSEESLQTNLPLMLKSSSKVSVPVVSMGTHCFTSKLLQRNGLKAWSGPFDWIFSSIPMIAHCIHDDFHIFMDPAYFRPVALKDRIHGPKVNRVNHSFYKSKFGVKNVFNHHDVHLEKDRAYMQRCVDRFRVALRSNEPHLFIVHEADSIETLGELRNLSAVLRSVGCFHRLVAFLIADPVQGGLLPSQETLHHDDLLIVHRYAPISFWEDLNFTDAFDESTLIRLIGLASGMTDAARAQRSGGVQIDASKKITVAGL